MPDLGGKACKKAFTASKPPAEAPIIFPVPPSISWVTRPPFLNLKFLDKDYYYDYEGAPISV